MLFGHWKTFFHSSNNLSSFTHPHVILNLYRFFLLLNTKEDILKNQLLVPIDESESDVTHGFFLCSAINPSKVHTHSSEHTHTVNTHPEQWAAIYAAAPRGAVGGSVPCSRASQSWYWGWRERCTFTPPTYNSCQTWDSNSQPLDYESDSLTIRPRLPPNFYFL